MAKLRSQLKESQEAAHSSRQRLEQQQLDNRRSITSPILSSNRKLMGNPDDLTSTKMELQRYQRRLSDMQQSIEAERQVINSFFMPF